MYIMVWGFLKKDRIFGRNVKRKLDWMRLLCNKEKVCCNKKPHSIFCQWFSFFHTFQWMCCLCVQTLVCPLFDKLFCCSSLQIVLDKNQIFLKGIWSSYLILIIVTQVLAFFTRTCSHVKGPTFLFSLATTPKWPNRYFSLGFTDCMQDCHC